MGARYLLSGETATISTSRLAECPDVDSAVGSIEEAVLSSGWEAGYPLLGLMMLLQGNLEDAHECLQLALAAAFPSEVDCDPDPMARPSEDAAGAVSEPVPLDPLAILLAARLVASRSSKHGDKPEAVRSSDAPVQYCSKCHLPRVFTCSCEAPYMMSWQVTQSAV